MSDAEVSDGEGQSSRKKKKTAQKKGSNKGLQHKPVSKVGRAEMELSGLTSGCI